MMKKLSPNSIISVREHPLSRSRRDFMRMSMASAGALAVVAGPLGSINALASTPRAGGRLRIGIGHGSTSDVLDPALTDNTFMNTLLYSMSNMLTEISATGELVPELAESWEASSDAKQWVFNLRRGVEFHNGKPITARDIIANINYHRDEGHGSSARPFVEDVESMEADGDHTVIVNLANGNADFAYAMSLYNFAIFPEDGNGSIDWQSHIGSGGYVIRNFEPGERALLERNPNYWKEDRAFFDEIEILSILDSSARASALLSAQVDVVDRVEERTLAQLAQVPELAVEETESATHFTFPMRADTPPFNDNNVRLALKHAVDRQALVDTILHGHGTVGNDHPVGPTYRYHAPDIDQNEYDPDKARYYLEQSGLDEISVRLHGSDAAFPGAVDAITLYREHAAPAGIDIRIERVPSDGYWSDVWMQKPWVSSYWSGTPTADGILSIGYAEGGSWNESFFSHERFNKLLREARAELDGERRAEMYRDMQIILRDEGSVVVPMFANNILARSTGVQHAEIGGNWPLDGMRLAERWWFAD